MLGRVFELDPRPLAEPRPLERKLVGNCRDFSVMSCGLLRQQGVAARVRCGFGAYFRPGYYEDHWVCVDLPPGRFVTGGQAWQLCRRGEEDSAKFGILDMHGQWFVAGDLVRDFLALNKVEILHWDPWGLMYGPETSPADDHLATLDR